jgi:nitric oxide dioxygenase
MSITRHPLWFDQAASRRWAVDNGLLARLAASLPRNRAEETQLAALFYGRLLDDIPALRPLFPTDLGLQTAKLVASLRTVLASVERPDEALGQLRLLGQSHVRYGAQPEHYGVVCERLADAIAELRGGDAELRRDWFDALQRVAAAMLPRP